MVLLSTPGGETTDALVVWLPDSKTLLSGNLFGPLFGHVPNLVTMRGDRYRDALTYVASLDVVLDLAPERLITGHFDPIEGADRIAAEVVAMRDATQWVHDRTVEGMNAGKDVHTLMSESHVARALRSRRGLREDQLERAGHLGELRRLVPPSLHHRALRRAAGGGGARPGGRGRCRLAGRPRRGHTSMPGSP